ncbi:MAG: transposase [Oleispira sp.]|nr:transposase [Oleispira sp.]
MRGSDITQEAIFTTVDLESFVPNDHPLRSIKPIIDKVLIEMDWKFSTIYSVFGRESIPPERLMRAQLLQVIYSIRSELHLVEQIQYNLLYRCFIGLTIDDKVCDHSTFTANRASSVKVTLMPVCYDRFQ